MTSQKPYLIRAMYDWCLDNELSPHLVVKVDEQTIAPKQYVQNEQIVLNISPTATKDILLENEWITFKAMFGGNKQDIAVPVGNVLAIFARETNQGMQFTLEENEQQVSGTEPKPSGLRLVK